MACVDCASGLDRAGAICARAPGSDRRKLQRGGVGQVPGHYCASRQGSYMWHCRHRSCAFKITCSDDCGTFDDVSFEYDEGADGR